MAYFIGRNIGRYHIFEQLGEGGMAVVYKAYDTRIERNVAIKVIRTDQLAPAILERAMKRFEREAKAVAKLNHPNIIKVIDYGEHEGQPYLVMEYMPGGTLKQLLKERGKLSWQEAAKMIIMIADALEYAHKQKIIHRDIKPSNILLTAKNEPILTDFGVAKVLDEETTQDLTGTSASVGTPEYMAPEQVTSKMVDHRADIYALGIVFYEMVTGRKPYNADTPLAVLFKHISDPLPRPRNYIDNLPEGVERIIFTALAKNLEDRYQSMEVFSSALMSLLNLDESEITEFSNSFNQSKKQQDIFSDNSNSKKIIKKLNNSNVSIKRSKSDNSRKIKQIGIGIVMIACIFVVVITLDFNRFPKWLVTKSPTLVTSNTTKSPTPIITSVPSSTLEFTITPTEVAYLSFPGNTNCRSGPATIYPIIESYSEENKVRILARNVSSDWYCVSSTKSGKGCWVMASLVSIEDSLFKISDLEVYTPIPTIQATNTSLPKPYVEISKTINPYNDGCVWDISYKLYNFNPNADIYISSVSYSLLSCDSDFKMTNHGGWRDLKTDETGFLSGTISVHSGTYTWTFTDTRTNEKVIVYFDAE